MTKLLPLVVAAVLALAGTAAAAGAAPPRKPPIALWGVKAGDTKAQVRAKWGNGYRRCWPRSTCGNTWIYLRPTGEPLAAVRFDVRGRVIAVLKLGGIRR